jgi:hypothetical protein
VRRLLLIGVLAANALATTSPPAQACFDCGATVGPAVGGSGVAAPSGGTHYIALTGLHTTIVAIDPSGAAQRWSTLRGMWGVPQVANDGTTAGVSGNRRTLVIERISYRYPQRTTRFAVLRTHSLRVRRLITLRGDFSFDAISPDGGRIYLIEHPRPGLASYRVREYDVAGQRLLARIITDPTRWGTVMHGTAVTRVSSPDGARAYTVYDKGNGRMFIHALDTVHGKAVCIDLPPVSASAAIGLQLRNDDATLEVTQDGAAFQQIDTSSYVMSPATTPVVPVATAPAAGRSGGGGGGLPAGPLAAIVAAVLAAAAAVVVVRRGRLPAWRPRSD